MITKDWLNYEIENINFYSWSITLNARDKEKNIINTYPIVFDTSLEVDEIVEVSEDNLVVEWTPWKNEGDSATATTVNKPIVRTEKTGKKIPNENYLNIENIEDVEKFIISKHWFTK